VKSPCKHKDFVAYCNCSGVSVNNVGPFEEDYLAKSNND